MLLALQLLNLFYVPRGGGGGSSRKRRFILEDGSIVYATREEIEYGLSLYRKLNPEEPVEVPAVVEKPRPVVIEGTPQVAYVTFPEIPVPVARLTMKTFKPEPRYDIVLKTIRRRRDEDAMAVILSEI